MIHRQLVWLALSISIGLATGCGGGSWNYTVIGTPRDPGAEGSIQVERIEGGNRLVTLSLRHMTPPERLGQGLSVFVVWFRDETGRSTKASALAYDAGSRTGRATATTPHGNFRVLVTAEMNNETGEPSENVVFNQDVRTE